MSKRTLPFQYALAEALGCNAPGEHPECLQDTPELLEVCRKYYGYLPGDENVSQHRELIEKLENTRGNMFRTFAQVDDLFSECIVALSIKQSEDAAPKSVERPVHETTTVLVWADVDVGIATVVEYLNTIPGVRTHASCQGTIGEGGAAPYRPQVLVTWPDAATFERLASEFDMSDVSESGHWCYVHPRESDAVKFARMEPEHPFRRREREQAKDVVTDLGEDLARDWALLERCKEATRGGQGDFSRLIALADNLLHREEARRREQQA